MSDAIRVAIVYGSASDTEIMSAAGKALDGYGVGYEEHVISAHRAPRTLVGWLEGLEARGVQAVIAGAGMSAALPGVVAAHTTLPVIGVPIKGGALGGPHVGRRDQADRDATLARCLEAVLEEA